MARINYRREGAMSALTTSSPKVFDTFGSATEREWDDIFAGPNSHSHSTDKVAGYIVRRTTFDGSTHMDIAKYLEKDWGRETYTKALEAAKWERSCLGASGRDGYVVIDWLYECGCRAAG
jgi:hypothetical protein